MAYSDLLESEQAYWDEYTCLRALTDWDGFDERLDGFKREARAWLDQRNDYIWRLANGLEGGEPRGWNTAKRRARYDQLQPGSLNDGEPRHEVRLPAPGVLTDMERVYLEAREVYLTIDSADAKQRARKEAVTGVLVKRRQQLYRLIKAEPRHKYVASRKRRYEALCIATNHGAAYKRWNKTHNKYGVPLKPPEEQDKGREWCLKHARSFLGTSEQPAGSNRGPHISDWQRRVIGADGYAWCACFTTCMAWDAGVEGAGSAGVVVCMTMAQRGEGIYRGFTRDPSRVRKGDHMVVSCSTCHIALVDGPTPYDTVEGNTSPGAEGSQFNGGTVADRNRRGNVVGWLLVRF